LRHSTRLSVKIIRLILMAMAIPVVLTLSYNSYKNKTYLALFPLSYRLTSCNNQSEFQKILSQILLENPENEEAFFRLLLCKDFARFLINNDIISLAYEVEEWEIEESENFELTLGINNSIFSVFWNMLLYHIGGADSSPDTHTDDIGSRFISFLSSNNKRQTAFIQAWSEFLPYSYEDLFDILCFDKCEKLDIERTLSYQLLIANYNFPITLSPEIPFQKQPLSIRKRLRKWKYDHYIGSIWEEYDVDCVYEWNAPSMMISTAEIPVLHKQRYNDPKLQSIFASAFRESYFKTANSKEYFFRTSGSGCGRCNDPEARLRASAHRKGYSLGRDQAVTDRVTFARRSIRRMWQSLDPLGNGPKR